MSESSVFPDLFHSFQVFTESGFEPVGDQLGIGSVLPVVSYVKEPEGDSVSVRVRKDILDCLAVFFGQLAGSEILDGGIRGGDLENRVDFREAFESLGWVLFT